MASKEWALGTVLVQSGVDRPVSFIKSRFVTAPGEASPQVNEFRPRPWHVSSSLQGAVPLARHNCPAAFRSAANVASDITSVRGLLLKGTAP
jgi:hypothetical protein